MESATTFDPGTDIPETPLTEDEQSRFQALRDSLSTGFTTTTEKVRAVDGEKVWAAVGIVASIAGGVIDGRRRVKDPVTDVFSSLFNTGPKKAVSDLTKGVIVLREAWRNTAS